MSAPIIVTLFRPGASGGAWLVIPEDESRPVGRWTPAPATAAELVKGLRGRAEGRFEVELLGPGQYLLQVRRRLGPVAPAEPSVWEAIPKAKD